MCTLLTIFDPSISGSAASVALSAHPPQRVSPDVAASDPLAVSPPPAPAPLVVRRGWRGAFLALFGIVPRASHI